MLGFQQFFFTAFFIRILYRNAVVLGDKRHSLHKGQVLLLHDKSDAVPSTVATETMKQFFAWSDRE